MIDFSCDKCGKHYSLKPEFAGRTTTCSGCKQPLVVPAATAVADASGSEKTAKISFSCMKCGMKFDVSPEFAGRKTTCPTCKVALVVPAMKNATVAMPTKGKIDGPASSLVQAHIDAEVTLAGSLTTGGSMDGLLGTGGKADGTRYVIESELARGGMGAVLRAIDCDIRREVAVKYLLDQSNAKNKIRFVEEAQITGQLEHPNIVPIHELGVDAQKRVFFTMKMVKGRSLAQIVRLLREEPITGEKEYPLGRLLNIFVSICNALAYAHSRGVVHRDLKPANIMVGDFGEVYVMDWGLAKVLDRTESMEMAAPLAFLAADSPDIPSATLADASGSGNVVTSRDSTADLTQVGAVMGTPVYMPPEQAAGRIAEIDERSDIYSMGAILYELLTLQPPIDKTGGFWPIVMRVGQGQIAAPEKKAPERAKAGKIPVELSAIAMKALAKEKSDRYQSVERLQRDIQLFLEGRSVSAKQDSNWEIFTKLVKRNKGASAGAGLAVVVLLFSMVLIAKSWHSTGRAYAAYRDEQEARRQAMKKSVPAFLAAANMAIGQKQFDQAQTQLDTALDIDPKNTRALLRKGQVLIVQRKFGPAREWLAKYLKLAPNDGDARELFGLCEGPDVTDTATSVAFGQILNRQQQFVLAESMFDDRAKLLQYFRQRLDTAYPGLGKSLMADKQGQLVYSTPGKKAGLSAKILHALKTVPINHLKLINIEQLTDLSPLQNLPLHSLDLQGLEVSDLTPLKGMPLKDLRLSHCKQVSDLTPLTGMKLERLQLTYTNVHSLVPIEGMPLSYLDLGGYAASTKKVITSLQFVKDMPLKYLAIRQAAIADLSPLTGMQLEHLELYTIVPLALEPLRGMPLRTLKFPSSHVTDFSPLEGAPLERLQISAASATDKRAIESMRRLDSLLEINVQKGGSMSPDEFFRRYAAK